MKSSAPAVAAALMLLASIGLATPASAAPSKPATDAKGVTAPSNQDTGGRAAPQSKNAVLSSTVTTATAPTITPSVSTTHVTNWELMNCPSGNFCAEVWDDTTNNWKVFYLYYCNTYDLSNWHRIGYYTNHQTGSGATAILYDGNFNKIASLPADNRETGVDWDPVWHIKNC